MTRKKSKPGNTAPMQPAADTPAKLEMARGVLYPPNLAANAIGSLNMASTDGDKIDISKLADALAEQSRRVIDGDLNRAQSLLICQAQTLDALFNMELMVAKRQDYVPQFEVHMKTALRAQAQCRATLETLAMIKHPPVFAKQANIAHGPQQVNNGPPPAGEPSRAGETENAQNRLLEQQHGERLDTVTTGAASGPDSAVATVGKGHGAEVRRR